LIHNDYYVILTITIIIIVMAESVAGARSSSILRLRPPCKRLNRWQHAVMEDLMKQSERAILFIVDTVGGRGKTFLAQYLKSKFPETHITVTVANLDCEPNFILKTQKLESIAFDYGRDVMPENFAWPLFVELKQAICKEIYKGPVKVIVFSNHDPFVDIPDNERIEASGYIVEVVNLSDIYADHGQAMFDFVEDDK